MIGRLRGNGEPAISRAPDVSHMAARSPVDSADRPSIFGAAGGSPGTTGARAGETGAVSAAGAEGATPSETLRQKDRTGAKLWKAGALKKGPTDGENRAAPHLGVREISQVP